MMRRKGRAAGFAAAGLLLPCSASAALWTLEPSAEMAIGGNSNYSLAEHAAATGQASASVILGASRQTEAATTRLDTRLTEQLLRGDLRQDEFLDQLTLSQTLKTERDTWSGQLGSTRTDTLQGVGTSTSANLILGHGIQQTTNAQASWVHSLTERQSVNASVSFTHAAYSANLVSAQNYDEVSLGSGWQYLLDERDIVTVQASHGDDHVLDRTQRSFIDNLDVGVTRNLDETQTLVANVGASRSRQEVRQGILVCPADVALCAAGLLQPVVEQVRASTGRWGLLYDLEWSAGWTPTTRSVAHAQRSVDPSGIGLTSRSTLFSAGLDHDWSERWHGGVNLTRSGSNLSGLTSAQQATLLTLDGHFSVALTSRWSLSSSIELQKSDSPINGVHAHAASFLVTLHYDGQHLEAHH